MSFPFPSGTIPRVGPPVPSGANIQLPSASLSFHRNLPQLNPNIAGALLGGSGQQGAQPPTVVTRYVQPDVVYQQPEAYAYPYPVPQSQQPQQVVVQQMALPSWVLPLGLLIVGGLVVYALVK